MSKRSFYIQESEFDDFQVKVTQRRTDKPFLVKGSAGSGKSILALWKVKQIQDENKGSYYFIVFTKTLKKYMKDGINELGLKSDRILYHWEWEKKLNSPSADYIIVDEAQDFSEKDVARFKASANKSLIMYGDTAQQLYNFRKDNLPINMEKIQYVTGFPLDTLVHNYRLPKKIARIAEYLLDDADELEFRCVNEGTELPKIIKYSKLNDQLDSIIEIIKARDFEDVGILLQTNSDVKYAKDYFDSNGLEVEAKFDNSIDLNFDNRLPKLTTYHSSKGLQFEAVFIPNAENIFADNKSAIYVATTRSYQSLYIMHSGNLSYFFNDIPNELYETSLNKKATRRL